MIKVDFKECCDWSLYDRPEPDENGEIKKIVMVGALLEHGSDDTPTQNDLNYLIHTLGHLDEMGIRTCPAPEVEICNLAYGDDFFKDLPEADLVILNYIFTGQQGCRAQTLLQSPELKNTSWKEAVRNNPSRYIVNITDEIEGTLNSQDLEGCRKEIGHPHALEESVIGQVSVLYGKPLEPSA